MTYPLSSDVVAGQPTAADHYNNLRADTLRLGQLVADAANLGAILSFYESGIHIDLLDTDRLRIPATTAVPACLVVDGVPVYTSANVDLSAAGRPAGGADNWYIFANRAAGSTIFTLTVNTSPNPAANQRLIGQFYWDGTAIVKDSIRTTLADFIAANLYLANYQVCNGRLTITSGSPIPPAGTTGTIYFTPFRGNLVSLYVADFGWRTYPFSELSISLAAMAHEENADVFIYDNAGTLTLELVIWSSDTVRAVALAVQDGILVKAGSLKKRYLGTLRSCAYAEGQVDDTLLMRGVWNYYNRMARPLFCTDDTVSWAYATAAWRQWRDQVTAKVEFVIGWAEEITRLNFTALIYDADDYGSLGIGLDVINANSAMSSTKGGSVTGYFTIVANYEAVMPIGYHYLALLEYGAAGSVTFYGQSATNLYMSGALGHVMA